MVAAALAFAAASSIDQVAYDTIFMVTRLAPSPLKILTGVVFLVRDK
jgi:hypothetical protein